MLTFPKLNSLNRDKFALSQFSSLDTRLYADSTCPVFEKNMSARSLPILASRQGRSKEFTIPFEQEKIVNICSHDYAYVLSSYSGMASLYCGDDFSSLKRVFFSKASECFTTVMLVFDNNICIFNLRDSETGTRLLVAPLDVMDFPTRVEAPDFVDVTVYKDRVLGCRKKQIRASAFDDVLNWDNDVSAEDNPDRSYLKNFSINSEFTACTTYKNRAIFFNESEMFELSGDNADEFDIVKIANVGCVNRNSLCEIDGKLYFTSREGIMCYTGTMPQKISAPIEDAPIKSESGYDSVLGGASGVLYASFMGEAGKRMYVCDIEKETWAVEDDINLVSIAGRNGKTYLATETNIFKTEASQKVQSDADEVDWEVVTHPIYAYTPRQKRASSIEIYVDQPKSSRIDIQISFDGGAYESVYSQMFSGAGELSIPLSKPDFQKMQIKIKGKGQASVHYIGLSYIQGGQVK